MGLLAWAVVGLLGVAAPAPAPAAPPEPRPVLLPPLTGADVRRVATNVDASLGRGARLARLAAASAAGAAALRAPGAYAAAALIAPARPPPFGAEFGTSAGVAILLNGQVRTLLSAPVQKFWRAWAGEPRPGGRPLAVVFGAIDLRTSNRGDLVGVRDWRTLDRIVAERDVVRAFQALGLPYVPAFNTSAAQDLRRAGAGEAAVHRAQIADVAGVRDLLAPPRRGPALGAALDAISTGIYLGYAKKVVAFGAMLRWERRERRSFGHVVFVRPDVVYAPLLDAVAGARFFARLEALVEGVALLNNDWFAALPRSHAFSHASSSARNPTAGFGVPQEFVKILVPPSNRTRFPRCLDRSSSLPEFSTTGERVPQKSFRNTHIEPYLEAVGIPHRSSYGLARLERGLDGNATGGLPAEELPFDVLKGATGYRGSVAQHSNMLAYDGLLFAGAGLEYGKGRDNIRYADHAAYYLGDGAPLWCYANSNATRTFGCHFVFIRETPDALCVSSANDARYLEAAWDERLEVCNRTVPPLPPRPPPPPPRRPPAAALAAGGRAGPNADAAAAALLLLLAAASTRRLRRLRADGRFLRARDRDRGGGARG